MGKSYISELVKLLGPPLSIQDAADGGPEKAYIYKVGEEQIRPIVRPDRAIMKIAVRSKKLSRLKGGEKATRKTSR